MKHMVGTTTQVWLSRKPLKESTRTTKLGIYKSVITPSFGYAYIVKDPLIQFDIDVLQCVLRRNFIFTYNRLHRYLMYRACITSPAFLH